MVDDGDDDKGEEEEEDEEEVYVFIETGSHYVGPPELGLGVKVRVRNRFSRCSFYCPGTHCE